MKEKLNLLQLYFDQIKSFPLLTFEEELEMAERIQRGEEAIRQKLVESNLRLVIKIARLYIRPDASLLDLIQEGNIGLIHAAERFDPERRVRFSTYATWWIKQSIMRYLVNKRRMIRLPHRKEEILRKIKQSYHVLTQQLNREPNPEEIARETGVRVKEVNAVLSMPARILSLDNNADEEDSAGLLEFQEDYTYNPERTYLNKTSKDATMVILNSLKGKEKEILMYRYQFNGSERLTLKKISDKMGMSPETIRQIEIRAIKKIRTNPELQQYLVQ